MQQKQNQLLARYNYYYNFRTNPTQSVSINHYCTAEDKSKGEWTWNPDMEVLLIFQEIFQISFASWLHTRDLNVSSFVQKVICLNTYEIYLWCTISAPNWTPPSFIFSMSDFLLCIIVLLNVISMDTPHRHIVCKTVDICPCYWVCLLFWKSDKHKHYFNT